MSHTHFQVQQLRARNMVTLTMSITMYIAALFTVILLPSLLMQYVFTDPQLMEQPAVMLYTPAVAFVIATAYFLYALVAVTMRELKARKLEKLAATDSMCQCNCGDCSDYMHGEHGHDMAVTDEEMAELESIVEKAMSKKPATKAGRKPSKRAAKK